MIRGVGRVAGADLPTPPFVRFGILDPEGNVVQSSEE